MRFLLTLVMFFAILWSSALLWFIYSMPSETVPPTVKSEAIVVLTGGAHRVEHGLEMLGDGAAPIVLISGVGERVSTAKIMRDNASEETRQKIADIEGQVVLDHVPRTTVSNAVQSAEFLQERNIHRIRLVTANYHMKRAMREFQDASPDLEIIADPVFPEEFHRDQWWRNTNTRRLVFSEFYKYLAILLRDAVRPSGGSA